jgi:hypothetical protein
VPVIFKFFGYRIDDFAYLTDVKLSKTEINKLKPRRIGYKCLREERTMHFNLKKH